MQRHVLFISLTIATGHPYLCWQIDRAPQNIASIPQYTRLWTKKENVPDNDNSTLPELPSNDNTNKFALVQAALFLYFSRMADGTLITPDGDEEARPLLNTAMTDLMGKLIAFGFYSRVSEVTPMMRLLVRCLDDRPDSAKNDRPRTPGGRRASLPDAESKKSKRSVVPNVESKDSTVTADNNDSVDSRRKSTFLPRPSTPNKLGDRPLTPSVEQLDKHHLRRYEESEKARLKQEEDERSQEEKDAEMLGDMIEEEKTFKQKFLEWFVFFFIGFVVAMVVVVFGYIEISAVIFFILCSVARRLSKPRLDSKCYMVYIIGLTVISVLVGVIGLAIGDAGEGPAMDFLEYTFFAAFAWDVVFRGWSELQLVGIPVGQLLNDHLHTGYFIRHSQK